MSSSIIEEIAEVSTGAIKKCVQTQFGWTSEPNGAKLRIMLKNKCEFYMNNNLTKQILDLEKKSFKDLKEMHEKLYCEKSCANARPQLTRQIAYRMQELEY
jgi:hypothetical protein